jgi:glucose/arabinose dehydrogenase
VNVRRAAVIGAAVITAAAIVVGLAYWRGWFAEPTVADAPKRSLPPAAVRTLVSGLEAPWDVAFLPDRSALVTERDSKRILAISTDGAKREVQRVEEAEPSGEGGLMGIAVSPTYDTDRLVYVYYTAADDNRIARMRLGERPEPILTGIPKAGNHNGGRIAFGPDGMLYAGTGDATDRGRSQDKDDLGGKILRMTPDGKPAEGNPFPGSVVWSFGHRNVQGLAWDSQDRMYASEFGQNTYDELNRISPGGNYGWPEVEGRGGGDRFAQPLATWGTDDASPSGIAIAGDRVYMACLRGERLYRIGLDGSGAEILLPGKYGRLRHVARAPDGSLWVLTSNRDGRGSPASDDDRIVRLEARGG